MFFTTFLTALRAKLKKISQQRDPIRLKKKSDQHDLRLVQSVVAKKQRALPKWRQLKYFKKTLLPIEKIIVGIFTFCIFISAIGLLASLYLQYSTLVPADGGDYTEGIVGRLQFINPVLCPNNEADSDICSLIFSGLFRYDPAKGIVPDIADNYEISADQKTYTIYLKQSALWHDKQKVTADDVLFTIEKIKDPNTKSPLYFGLNNVKAEKITDYSLRLTLNDPYAPFLESLTFGILPKHIWQNIPAQEFFTSKYNLEPIGSGPFKFGGAEKDANKTIIKFTAVSFKNFYIAAPHLDALHFKFYGSYDQTIEALNNKNVEGISYLPKYFEDKITNHGALNFHQLQLPQYTALFLNAQKAPLLGYPKIRQLLAQTIDKNKIINDILNGEAIAINDPLFFSQPKLTAKKYDYNLAAVKSGLNDMGWKLADYKKIDEKYPFRVRSKNKQYMNFVITTINQPENIATAELIKNSWQALGIKTDLEIFNAADLSEKIKNRDYEILLYAEISGFDPDQYPFWHSSQAKYPGLNLSLYQNPNADKLLEDARKTADQKIRAAKYAAFQQILTNDVPAIFLFSPTYTYPQNKKLLGFDVENIISPANRFSNVAEWHVNLKREL
ncbi:hypothetical protein HY932_02855 [Candidatus Falkowbacteria bacterium]|nr:hypothetical protein [Candidatus Falkowbacteria bacterium]